MDSNSIEEPPMIGSIISYDGMGFWFLVCDVVTSSGFWFGVDGSFSGIEVVVCMELWSAFCDLSWFLCCHCAFTEHEWELAGLCGWSQVVAKFTTLWFIFSLLCYSSCITLWATGILMCRDPILLCGIDKTRFGSCHRVVGLDRALTSCMTSSTSLVLSKILARNILMRCEFWRLRGYLINVEHRHWEVMICKGLPLKD